MWNQDLCLDAPQILLSELTKSCRLDLDCFAISLLFLSSQGTAFRSKCVCCNGGVALPDDAAGDATTLGVWGQICIRELGCKMFGM